MNAKDSLSQEGEDDARLTHWFSDQCAVESLRYMSTICIADLRLVIATITTLFLF